MKQGQRCIYIAMYPHLGANVVIAKLVGWDLKTQTFKAYAVVVVDPSIMLLTKEVRQTAADERHVRRALQSAGHSKLPVVLSAVHLLQVLVGILHIGDSCAGQLLGQAALMRLKYPLAAPARLG